MTVIAWDGTKLSADKMMDCNGYPASTTKIFRALDGALIGGCGDSDAVAALRQWYINGANAADFPENRDTDGCARGRLLVITPNGAINLYLCAPIPCVIEDKYYAMGSGGDFAIAAMYLGNDAEQAVVVASELDNHCGRGITTLELHRRPSANKDAE